MEGVAAEREREREKILQSMEEIYDEVAGTAK
jgi:hypothetical protein